VPALVAVIAKVFLVVRIINLFVAASLCFEIVDEYAMWEMNNKPGNGRHSIKRSSAYSKLPSDSSFRHSPKEARSLPRRQPKERSPWDYAPMIAWTSVRNNLTAVSNPALGRRVLSAIPIINDKGHASPHLFEHPSLPLNFAMVCNNCLTV
jgi:hypothetical protein